MEKLSAIDYSLVSGDLDQAREFLKHLKEANVNGAPEPVKLALTLAAVVSYMRPFKRSREGNKTRQLAPASLPADLPDPLRKFHDRLKTERDQAWARTDFEAHGPIIPVGNGFTIRRNPWRALKNEEVRIFDALVEEVDRRVTAIHVGASLAP